MKSFAEELWYGNIMPSEEPYSEENEKGKIKKEYRDAAYALRDTLSEQQRRLFDEYCTAAIGFGALCEKRAFCKGFHYGIRLLVDVISFDEKEL